MRSDFAVCSFLFQRVRASVSAVVAGELTVGQMVVPSKWPQKPFASSTSWKQSLKTVQFRPVGSSLGIDEGRRSVVVKAVDIVTRVAGKAGPNNL